MGEIAIVEKDSYHSPIRDIRVNKEINENRYRRSHG
jgi:hypothetical protein